MSIGEEEFYDLSNPRFLQQGDIFPGLPLINPPASRELLVLRDTANRGRLEDPSGEVQIVQESVIGAFDERAEFVVVSANRGAGILLTQTCDLQRRNYCLISPLRDLSGDVNRGHLFAGRYASLFGLPKHPLDYYEEAYVDFSDLRLVYRESIEVAQRIATLTRKAQNELGSKLAYSLGRRWGYEPGLDVPHDGKYRCHGCNSYYGVDNPERDFKKGQKFPDCPNCRRKASWYQLVPFRGSMRPSETEVANK